MVGRFNTSVGARYANWFTPPYILQRVHVYYTIE